MRKHILILVLFLSAGLNAQQSTRFMVVADPHIYSPSSNFRQTILFELTVAAIEEQVDFIFFPGDLAIRKPADSTQIDTVLMDWRFVLDTLKHHNIRVLACRGNNDAYSGYAWDSLFTGDCSFPVNGPETEINRTYAFEFNDILFALPEIRPSSSCDHFRDIDTLFFDKAAVRIHKGPRQFFGYSFSHSGLATAAISD